MPCSELRLMEVCGTHTMAIARAGLKSLLPEGVELVSGPGCPVCVTPPEVIDAALDLAMRPGVVIATYGDMVRVPGRRRGDSLARRRAMGARVMVVYSPMDAVDWAESHPGSEVVFLGVGFETTAPGTAASLLEAAGRGVRNFSVFSMLKRVEPALRALTALEGFNIQGFLCPGHVATIIGAEGFRFLPEEYGLPAVVAGFEPEDILLAVSRLISLVRAGRAELENLYGRAVKAEGNPLAIEEMRRVFVPAGKFALQPVNLCFRFCQRAICLRAVGAQLHHGVHCKKFALRAFLRTAAQQQRQAQKNQNARSLHPVLFSSVSHIKSA